MQLISCEKKENNEIELIVEVSAEEFDSAVGKSFIKNRKSVSVPGFRRGKAPRKIVERMYGDTIFHPDAFEILAPDAVSFAVKNSDTRLVGTPHVTDVDIKEETGLVELVITAAAYPEVTIGEYKGLSAEMPDVEVPEFDIDKEIAAVRHRNARIEAVERPAADGDITVIDFEGFVDGEPFEGGKSDNYELELGSGAFIPGFEEAIHGMAVGEQRDIELTFPDNYTEPLAGKPVVFKVKLNELKESLLPELDDEFAKDVSEFDTLAEYKADIREKLEKAKKEEADVSFENALMDQVAETLSADIPEAMLEEHLEGTMSSFLRQLSAYGMEPARYFQMMNLTPEGFRENMRVKSEKQLKVTLALEKIAELEGIEVSDEDLENEYKDVSERVGKDVEEIKKSVQEEEVVNDLKMRAALKVVTGSATALSAADDKAEKSEKPQAKPKKQAAKKPAAKKGQGEADKPKEPTVEEPAAIKPEGE